MTVMFEQPSLISAAPIPRFRFITISNGSNANTTAIDADFEAAVANTGEPIIGITTGASQDAPQDSANSFAAKEAGVSFEWISPGAIGLLHIDKSAGVTRGDRLMANTNAVTNLSGQAGSGVTATSGQWVGALALENAAAGEIARVLVLSPFYYEEG